MFPDPPEELRPGSRTEFANTRSALLAIASEPERQAYEKELAAPPIVDDHGGETRDTTIEEFLLLRLMEKLRSGEWVASGFGYESGQPMDLHPRLWQRLFISVSLNSAHDELYRTRPGPSTTGTFHSLGFRIASPKRSANLNDREAMILQIAVLFETLDYELPVENTKKHFFHEARQRIGELIPEAWLVAAWKKADLRPFRRLPGNRSNRSNNAPTD